MRGALKDLLSVRGLIQDAPLLAEAIVDTVRESLLLLDDSLIVILANRSFYLTFGVELRLPPRLRQIVKTHPAVR